MSLEMAHKVIVPQKKIMSRSFLNSGTLIVIIYFRQSSQADKNQLPGKFYLDLNEAPETSLK
jgi:hypothetical protein